MDLKQQIFYLLEPEEKERLIPLKDRQEFEQQCDQVLKRVLLPVFKKMQKEFRRCGRSIDLSPDCFPIFPPGFSPRLRVAVPDGRAFIYWIEIERTGDKLCIAHHHWIKDGKPQCFKELLPRGRPRFVDDLAEVHEEHIQRDSIELNRQHNTVNKSFRRHAL